MRTGRLQTTAAGMLFLLAANASAFTENFEGKEIPKGWQKGLGLWEVQNGVMRQSEMGRNRFLAYAVNDTAWKDYELTVKIRPISATNYAGVLVRVQKLGSGDAQWATGAFYYWLIGIGGNYSKIWEAPSGAAVEGNPGSTLIANKWNEVKVVAKGNSLSCYLNGKLEKEYADKSDAHPYGGIGLATYDAEAEFDDVEVKGPGIPGLAVEASGKVAVRWGELRAER